MQVPDVHDVQLMCPSEGSGHIWRPHSFCKPYKGFQTMSELCGPHACALCQPPRPAPSPSSQSPTPGYRKSQVWPRASALVPSPSRNRPALSAPSRASTSPRLRRVSHIAVSQILRVFRARWLLLQAMSQLRAAVAAVAAFCVASVAYEAVGQGFYPAHT